MALRAFTYGVSPSKYSYTALNSPFDDSKVRKLHIYTVLTAIFFDYKVDILVASTRKVDQN